MNEKTKATYLVTEDDIVKISTLFGHLESAIKELVRNRRLASINNNLDAAEFDFYELASRSIYECAEDAQLKRLGLDDYF